MPPTQIRGSSQIKSLTVTTDRININADLTFNKFQATNLIVHKGTSFPGGLVAGDEGFLFYRTDTNLLHVFDGTVFSPVTPPISKDSFLAGTPSGPYTGSLSIFDLSFTYTTGNNSLLVFSGGVLMAANGEDYTETDSDTVTFVSNRLVGERISFLKIGP